MWFRWTIKQANSIYPEPTAIIQTWTVRWRSEFPWESRWSQHLERSAYVTAIGAMTIDWKYWMAHGTRPRSCQVISKTIITMTMKMIIMMMMTILNIIIIIIMIIIWTVLIQKKMYSLVSTLEEGEGVGFYVAFNSLGGIATRWKARNRGEISFPLTNSSKRSSNFRRARGSSPQRRTVIYRPGQPMFLELAKIRTCKLKLEGQAS